MCQKAMLIMFIITTISAALTFGHCVTGRYGSKLNFEKELGLRLKGENGIMKKKFSALQKDIEDQREEIRTMFAHKKELYQVRLSSLTWTASRIFANCVMMLYAKGNAQDQLQTQSACGSGANITICLTKFPSSSN